MRYLVSINDIPNNIILADSQDIANHCASVAGGTARLLADDEVVEFPPPPPVPREMQLTKLQFLRLFTAPERIAIRASSDPVIVDFMQLLDLAQDVRLDDPDTVQGLHYLESDGLIAPGRAHEILGQPMGWLIARLAEMAGVSVAVSADNTNEALAIAVTGFAETTIGWTCSIFYSQA